jgi:hypothetical protein
MFRYFSDIRPRFPNTRPGEGIGGRIPDRNWRNVALEMRPFGYDQMWYLFFSTGRSLHGLFDYDQSVYLFLSVDSRPVHGLSAALKGIVRSYTLGSQRSFHCLLVVIKPNICSYQRRVRSFTSIGISWDPKRSLADQWRHEAALETVCGADFRCPVRGANML